MHIGKRLFPYPILNSERLFSQFKQSLFSLQYEEEIDKDNSLYSFKNVRCVLENDYLKTLVSEGKANIVCVIECAPTMFRRTYNLGLEPKDIKVSLMNLNGKVSVSAFIVATENISNYKCDDFLDDYDGYAFSVEKHDILAVDDGFVNRIDFNSEEEDNKKSSIFLVIKDKTIKDETMLIDFDSEKITISLPEEQYNRYYKTKSKKNFFNLYFSIMVVPALGYAISRLQRDNELVDQLRIDYKWFNAFAVAYKEAHKEELTDEEFIKMNGNKEAQVLFNMPVTKALDDIFDLTIGSFGGFDDDN